MTYHHGAPDALEVLGPHGWYFRLAPESVANIWPCGPAWSWVRMKASGRDPLLVRGNAVTLIAQCDELCTRRRARLAACAKTDFRTSTQREKEATP
jgi:hypothetical protein